VLGPRGLAEESVGLTDAESGCLGDTVRTISCRGECRMDNGVGRNKALPFVGRESGENGGAPPGRSELEGPVVPGVRPETMLAVSEPPAVGFAPVLLKSNGDADDEMDGCVESLRRSGEADEPRCW
jgi:hypothetical protein